MICTKPQQILIPLGKLGQLKGSMWYLLIGSRHPDSSPINLSRSLSYMPCIYHVSYHICHVTYHVYATCQPYNDSMSSPTIYSYSATCHPSNYATWHLLFPFFPIGEKLQNIISSTYDVFLSPFKYLIELYAMKSLP